MSEHAFGAATLLDVQDPMGLRSDAPLLDAWIRDLTTERSPFQIPGHKGRSVGRVCAELICPYPPGVPVLSPGERITQQAFDALMGAKESGVRIAFVADPSLATIKVLPN